MEPKRPKYSLFPLPPSSNPVFSLRPPSPVQDQSSTSKPEDPTTYPRCSPSPLAEPLPPEPHDTPHTPEPSHSDYDSPLPAQHQSSPDPDPSAFPSEMTPSLFSSASASSLKPAPLSFPSPRQQPRKSPKRAFIRHGLGGAGNYHKRPDSAPNSDYSGFLSAFLGTFSNKKRKTQQYPEANQTGYSQYSSQALPLGAAEVLKRKMLGQASGGKRRTGSDRN